MALALCQDNFHIGLKIFISKQILFCHKIYNWYF